MIFGVAVVFPVVITFGVDSPGVAPGKANSCAPVNNVPLLVPVIITDSISLRQTLEAYPCRPDFRPDLDTPSYQIPENTLLVGRKKGNRGAYEDRKYFKRNCAACTQSPVF